MRLLLLAACVAVAGVVSLLVLRQPDHRRIEDRPHQPQPSLPNGETPVTEPLPEPRKRTDEFLAACKRRGTKAVAELLDFLRSGKDEQLLPRWKFENKRLIGFPSLRAIYIEALRQIPGPEATAALAAILNDSESVPESYLIALALDERAERGWAGTLLTRAAGNRPPALLSIKRSMVELAARRDPATTAAHLLEHAPRGKDPEAPRILATGITYLPIDQANATGERLLADAGITAQAKVLYARALLQRTELSAIRTLTTMAERRELDERMRIETAYAAVDAGGFFADLAQYQTSIAKGDRKTAQVVWERFERRLAEVEHFVQVALNLDLKTSEDPRAKSLRRLLDAHRKRMGAN